ncbi:MAG: M28 family peptidase [Cytophagales bacterium]|nr:M28 family peptidase [Cytophagales bacterium]
MKNSILSAIAIFVLLCSCGNNTTSSSTISTQTGTSQAQPKKEKFVPVFSQDSAFRFIEKQVAFGPRVPNTPEHIACGDYLINKLKEVGSEVTVQDFTAFSFDNKELVLRNIVGSVNPEMKKRVLLAAHWDTRPFADQEPDENKHHEPIDGANDGASGVGVLIEVLRVAQLYKDSLNVGVDVIFYDGEDYGQPHFYDRPGGYDMKSWCLGSQYWANKHHKEGYHAYYGILLDMIGAKNARFYHEGLSEKKASGILKKVWKAGHEAGYGEYFVYKPSPEITDDHVYMNQAGIPTIDIIDYQPTEGSGYFCEAWHTHDDNMSVIDKNSLEAVGQTLIRTLFLEK